MREKSKAAGEEKKEDKKEDWLLVSRVTPEKTMVGGAIGRLWAAAAFGCAARFA